jgi:hypothetical protein
VTLGFLLLRRGAIKVVGSIIQAALDRGHRVVLVWDPVEAKPGEQVSEADLAAWPHAVRVAYRRVTPLLPVLEGAGVDALVAPSIHYLLSAMGLEKEIDPIRRAGVRLFSVDYVFETITSEPESFLVTDVTFYTSEYQRELHWRLFRERFAALASAADRHARSAVAGSTMNDQLAIVDPDAVRRRFGVARGRPVVLFMSLKMAVPDAWRRLMWGSRPRAVRALHAVLTGRPGWVPQILAGHGYRELVEAVRDFCRRTGAALIVKSRAKNADPPFLSQGVDAFVYDDAVYPYTSIELMSIASLCVHFQSGAVLEAAAAGVPSLSVSISQEHLRTFASFDEVYGAREGSLQNFPGIVWSLDSAAATARLRTASLAHFTVDAAARRRYIEKFLGFDDRRASVRVLERIESAVPVTAARGAAPPRG